MDSGQLTHLQMMRYRVVMGTVKLDTSATFTVQINPADFQHSTGVRYDKTKAQGENANTPRYSAVDEENVTFSLVLDGTGVVPPPAGGQREDVKTQLKQLNAVAYEVTPKGEPPLVRLLWGTLIFFGRMESMRTQYTLFKPSGEPLRAKIDLSFVGAMSRKENELVSNRSSSRAPAVVVVQEGQTLPELCQEHYGEPYHMLEVARYNGLPSIMAIQPGMRLMMPPSS